MIARLLSAFVLVVMLPLGHALAVTPDEILDDPALEARARSLSAELRCMVCQNQSIDDSNAPLAKDLRVLVRERLVAGDTDEEVMDYLVSRYGEFVLLKPRFAWHNALLWAAGPAALLAGLIAIVMAVRKRSGGSRQTVAIETARLSSDEEKRLQELLDRAD